MKERRREISPKEQSKYERETYREADFKQTFV